MSMPAGASPEGSVATGTMPVQSTTRPSRTIAAIKLPDRESATTQTTTSCMPAQPRRRAYQTAPPTSNIVSASAAIERVGMTLATGPSTSIAWPVLVTNSESVPTKPAEPSVVTATRMTLPAAGIKEFGM